MVEISVIIPVYNGAEKMADTLDSIYNQTFKNFELILVNDGSTDNIIEIVNNYKKNNSIKNMELITTLNKGVSNARNIGIEKAKGRYIMFLDSDDLFKENMLQEMYNTLNKNDSDVCIAGFEYVFNSNLENKITKY